MLGSREPKVITQLLKAGVDVNQKNMLGMNALLLVAGYGDDRMVKMVLDAGADANATNDFGHTALHLAIVGKRSQMKKITSGQTGAFGLNRRNIDVALKEWSRLHKDVVRGTDNDQKLESVGQFMMHIGSKLDDPDTAMEDDQEAMKRRVEAVWQHRQVCSGLVIDYFYRNAFSYLPLPHKKLLSSVIFSEFNPWGMAVNLMFSL